MYKNYTVVFVDGAGTRTFTVSSQDAYAALQDAIYLAKGRGYSTVSITLTRI